MDVWVEHELQGCQFPDQRLRSRIGNVLGNLSGKIGDSIPTGCQDWAATKAAYRFLNNERVNEQEILAGHFHATRKRFSSVDDPILVLHVTTEFSYTRSDTQAIGQTRKVAGGHRDKTGQHGFMARHEEIVRHSPWLHSGAKMWVEPVSKHWG